MSKPSTLELAKAIERALGGLPLRLMGAPVRIRNAASTSIAAYGPVEIHVVMPKGPASEPARSVGQFYEAIKSTILRANACVMTGQGIQGPIIVDEIGGRWAPTTTVDIDSNSSRWPVVITCHRIPKEDGQ